MTKNNINEYSPIPLSISSLDPGEIHQCSFCAYEYVKACIGYKMGAIFPFSCHLTDKRLIIEPYQPKKWESLAASASSLVMNSLTDNPLGNYQIKNSVRMQKALKGKYFEFYYEDIHEFMIMKYMYINKLVKIVLKPQQATLKEVSLLFMPTVNVKNLDKTMPSNIKEILNRIKKTTYYCDDFVEIGNRIIKSI
jgi:hypothetical protein